MGTTGEARCFQEDGEAEPGSQEIRAVSGSQRPQPGKLEILRMRYQNLDVWGPCRSVIRGQHWKGWEPMAMIRCPSQVLITRPIRS